MFDVAGDAYGQFMGRYSEPLAKLFVDWVGVRPGDQVIDVGCGPGALTAVLVDRLGLTAVSAVDPSPPFLSAVRRRLPGLDVQAASAEQLPYSDGFFDHAIAQLAVHFMKDPVAGLCEMARVTRPGGWVSAAVWDLGGGRAPVSRFYAAALNLDPAATTEDHLPGTHQGDLVRLLEAAELSDVRAGELEVTVAYETFDEWWEPYTYGVGPAGQYVSGLDDAARLALREECRRLLPAPPFEMSAVAWVASGCV